MHAVPWRRPWCGCGVEVVGTVTAERLTQSLRSLSRAASEDGDPKTQVKPPALLPLLIGGDGKPEERRRPCRWCNGQGQMLGQATLGQVNF